MSRKPRPKKLTKTTELYKGNNNAPNNKIFITPKLEPRTESQSKFLEAITKYDILFASGPAGCGKTMLATARGLLDVLAGKYKQLVLIRPAVEAGEKLGFLPGSAFDKVSLYMEPMYDCIKEFITAEEFIKLEKDEKIVIKPLAYLRGKTFKNSYIVADEMQNASHEQIKLLVTRIGIGSKMVISGDITQSDIYKHHNSLDLHIELFHNKNGNIGAFKFLKGDSIRHKIINEYLEEIEKYENKEQERKNS